MLREGIVLIVCLANSFFLSLDSHSQDGINNLAALDSYAEFIHESNKWLLQKLRCTKDFYKQTQFQKRMQSSDKNTNASRRLYARFDCAGLVNEYKFKKAQETGGNLFARSAKKIWGLLQKVNSKLQAIDTYCKLETYKEDLFKESDHLLEEVGNVYLEIQQEIDSVNVLVFKSNHPNGNQYHSAAKLMASFIEREKKFLKTFTLKFNDKLYTGWDTTLIRKNVEFNLEYKNKLKQVNLQGGTHYDAKQQFYHFQRGVDYLIDSKMLAMNQFYMNGYSSDEFKNRFYLEWFKAYGVELERNYALFLKRSRVDNNKYRYIASFTPQLSFDTESVKYIFLNNKYEKKELEIIDANTATKGQITPNLNDHLNQVVDCINWMVLENKSLQSMLWKMHRSIKNILKSDSDRMLIAANKYIHFKARGYTIPRSQLIKIGFYSNNFPEAYRINLLRSINALYDITYEIEYQTLEILDYLEKEKFLSDKFEDVSRRTKRLIILFDEFDLQKEKVYSSIKNIYDSYEQDDENSWVKSANALRKALPTAKEILDLEKEEFKSSTKSNSNEKIDSLKNNLKIYYTKLVEDQYSNLKGLKKIGSTHGDCPYSAYEWFNHDLKAYFDRIEDYEKSVDFKTKWSKLSSLAYGYNSLVSRYDKIVSLADKPLLEGLKQQDLLRFPEGKPEDNSNSGSNQNIDNSSKSMEGYAFTNITLLLDVSASMRSPEKLPLFKKSLENLLQIMRKEDELSIVQYSGSAKVALKPISARKKKKIVKTIESLKPKGRTNIYEGLKLAYQTVESNKKPSTNDKVILITDGIFRIDGSLNQLIDRNSEQGIQLTIFSYGKSTDSDDSLKKLVEKGRGKYLHVTADNSEEMVIREAQKRLK